MCNVFTCRFAKLTEKETKNTSSDDRKKKSMKNASQLALNGISTRNMNKIYRLNG